MNPPRSQRENLSPAARRFYNLPKTVRYQPLVPDLIRYNAEARARYAAQSQEVQS